MKAKSLLLSIFVLIALTTEAKPIDYLHACWKKQVESVSRQFLSLHYQEKKNELEHSFEPWQQTNYTGKGIVWSNANNFLKNDTLTTGQRIYYSKTQYNESTLLFLDYGDKDLFAVTKAMFENQVFVGARYSPITVINYFAKQKPAPEKESDKEFAIFKLTINNTIVKLCIRKSDYLLDKVTTLSNDELFGDVLTTYAYKNYKTINGLSYPALVEIEKINGKVKDEVTISSANTIAEVPAVLSKPDSYQLKEADETKPEITVEKYSGNIYFVELKHTDDKVMIVEFKDFLLVAEAPLNSTNGELIISEAKKIAPHKPIKYFVFSHYHPHYTGGIRPFVHKRATIFSTKADVPYLQYLTTAPHTLEPDSLQTHPKPLLVEEISDSKTVTDGKFEMKIFFIGNKSQHTNDYLIYYFPSEQMVFEGDLVWVARQGAIKKAGARQAGLYNAVKELGLNVKTVIQSWPVKDYGVKTVIPFTDLEQSMK